MTTNENQPVKGYKVFSPDWTCMGFQYEVGKTFEEDVTPSCCNRGFHFCKELKDCFNYYSFNPDNKVAKVIALGEIDEKSDDSKCCTNKIQIIEEISWEDVLRMVNLGKGNAGLCNTGNNNTGNSNTDDCNTGNRNTGNNNTGNRNTGNWNTGNWNTGDGNTDDFNTGDWNTGNNNTGSNNTGDWNTGNWNTGDWNTIDASSGCFCTEDQKILIFDKPSKWTIRDWWNSSARQLLNQIPKYIVKWIYESDMTDIEKEENPTYKTTGGYLKIINESETAQVWWDGLNTTDKNIIKSIPNFDAEKFEKCTGIRV